LWDRQIKLPLKIKKSFRELIRSKERERHRGGSVECQGLSFWSFSGLSKVQWSWVNGKENSFYIGNFFIEFWAGSRQKVAKE
jgi:hypothetical protein